MDRPTLQRSVDLLEQAVSLDPSFAQAWAGLSEARSFLYINGDPLPELAEAARAAAERCLALAPGLLDGRVAMGTYFRTVLKDPARALEEANQGLAIDPKNADLLSFTASSEWSLGRWKEALAHLEQAVSLDPRSPEIARARAWSLFLLRNYPEAHRAYDEAVALSPDNIRPIQEKAMVFLAQGDLAAAREWLAEPRDGIREVDLTYQMSIYWDLVWVLDEARQKLLMTLPVEAFGGDPAGRALAFAQVYAFKGDAENQRRNAAEAERAIAEQLSHSPGDAQLHVLRGLSLAYAGRRDDAIREGERAVAMLPVSREAYLGPYIQHQLARIYIILGEKDKALDELEPLLKIPYFLSPGWLRIDPNFAPLKGHPRFEKLAAR